MASEFLRRYVEVAVIVVSLLVAVVVKDSFGILRDVWNDAENRGDG